MRLNLYKHAVFYALIITFIMLTINSGCIFGQARVTNFGGSIQEGLPHRINRELPPGGNPSPAADPNSHVHH
ncbi:Hypothetical predicted protein [Olea europaea subsp. europaea]|uniref:Uncharacterized protein n=1 Tax=Olea europaea subsp. europaea TaxID=158383 RepID=A0A8S0VI51_OLEEU|nr:Hypothetical predicted protein [Olea europaea subsp. europaea]